MSKLRIWGALFVVIVVAGVAVYFGVLRGRWTPPPAPANPARSIATLSPEEKRRTYDGDVKALRDRLAHMQAFVDGFSRELVDVAALGRSLTTPEAAFAYVRDEVALEPYPGVMKGAGGTLVARGGNTVDRALLLASLLAENGIDARIARGKLPAPQTEALLQQISNAPDAIQLIARSLPATRQPSPPDGQRSIAALQSQADARAKTTRNGADESVRAVRASLQEAGLSPGGDLAAEQMAILRDHFWVQATVSGTTIDLDPSFSRAQVNQKVVEADATYDPHGLPDDLFQRIAIRVTGDFLENGATSSTQLLAKEMKAVDLFGQNIRLTIEPAALKRDQNDYGVTLSVGDEAPQTARLQIRATVGGAQPQTGQPASPFGGIGRLGGEERPRENSAQAGTRPTGETLGRLSVDVVSRVPHIGEARYRRIVLDRLDTADGRTRLQPGWEDDNAARTLLPQVWDGAISMGATHPLYVFTTELETLKAQQQMAERALAAKYLGEAFTTTDLTAARLPPQLVNYFFYSSLTHHLVASKDAPHVRQYCVRPQLAFLRHGFALHDWSRPNESRRFQDGIDLVNTPYGFVGPGDLVMLGLKIGVADTVLERAFAKPGTDFNTVPLLAAARAQKIPLLAVGPGQASRIDGLTVPAAIRNVLRDELAQGRTLVLPTALVTLNQVRTFGWWSIDASNGVALGKMDLGAGQGLVEYSKLREKINDLTHIIGKFYGGVLGCYMMTIADQLAPPDGPYEVLDVPGLPKIEGGKDLGACVATKACEAIVELAILAASSAAYHEEAEDMIEKLYQMMAKAWIAEEGAAIGCEGLEGGEGHRGH